LSWGPAPKDALDLELSPVADLASLLERLREEVVDLVLLSEPTAPLLRTVELIVEADPGVVLLVARDVIALQEREALFARLPVFSCAASELTPGLVSAVAQRAASLRGVERRANATEAALRAARRWREETEAGLRDLFHDLRTPVAVALGWCSNLADGIEGPIEERQRGVLGRARSALETMGQLLESGPPIPALAEAVGGLLELEKARERRRRRLRVDELATEILGMLEVEAQKKKVVLELRAESELPAIWGERVRLAQLFLNLLGNALRHARSRVIVRVERAPGEDRERTLRILVEDDGLGFGTSLIEHAFERGVSGDSRSGLGLSIVKEITREHGGRCSVQNLEAGGASVQVQLPVDPRSRARPPIEILTLDDELLLGQLVTGLVETDAVDIVHLRAVEGLLESLRQSGGRVLVSEVIASRIGSAVPHLANRSRGGS
jgi:signal transduction histidine kinase